MLLLDFYIDEPACFGVPPYLSPYCRYTAGALVSAGIPQEEISYLTVDEWRRNGKELRDEPEIVFLIAGSTVPGKYLGGKIGTVAEILEFLTFRKKRQKKGITIIGGPIRNASLEIIRTITNLGGFLISGDLELYASELAGDPRGLRKALESNSSEIITFAGKRRSYEQVDRWAVAGAFLSNLHPNFPNLIIELETYRGCTRDIYCSFCTEALHGRPYFRSVTGIINEVSENYKMGNRYFRLGRQADLMSYLPFSTIKKNSFPKPNPQSIRNLYTGIRRAAPQLKLLHLDNINPGLIATFPAEARKITQIICEYNTPGDTAAMGIESVDLEVIKLNRLKCNAEEALRAIEIINEFGATRSDGIPRLLPGLNFLTGLPGESENTFKSNFEFLLKILNRGLLLRRINLRHAISYRGTLFDSMQKKGVVHNSHWKHRTGKQLLEQRFRYYRALIRREIDTPMLKRTFPPGSIIKDVFLETKKAGYYLARPLGSYPVVIKIPERDPLIGAGQYHNKTIRVIITGASGRSLTGLSHPIRINQLGRSELMKIPGIGPRAAFMVFSRKPVRSFAELKKICATPIPGNESDYDFTNDF